MSLTQRIARDSLTLTLLVILGRAVGFLVPLLLARWYGATFATDAFFLVLVLPMMVISLLNTAVVSSLNPAYARLKASAPDQTPGFLGGALLSVAFALVLLAGALALVAPPALRWLLSDRPETAALAITLVFPLLGLIPLAGMGMVLRGALEVERAFLLTALAPMARGALLLLLVASLHARYDIAILPWCFLMGEGIQLAGLALAARHRGLEFKLQWAVPPALKETLLTILPLLLGEAAVNLNILVDKGFAAQLVPGALTALDYADRVRVIPETVLSAGLLTVVFSHWSSRSAAGQWGAIRDSFDRIARWLTVLLAPALVALMVLRLELIQLLFQGGRFDGAATGRTAEALTGYLPGILPMMLAVLAVKFLLVRRRIRPVVLIGLLSFGSNALLDALMIGPLGVLGLSLSTSVNQEFTALLLYWVALGEDATLLQPGFWGWCVARVLTASLAGLGLGWGVTVLGLEFWGRVGLVGLGMGALLVWEGWRHGLGWEFMRPGGEVEGGPGQP